MAVRRTKKPPRKWKWAVTFERRKPKAIFIRRVDAPTAAQARIVARRLFHAPQYKLTKTKKETRK